MAEDGTLERTIGGHGPAIKLLEKEGVAVAPFPPLPILSSSTFFHDMFDYCWSNSESIE